jgi:small conductance mechanosensitive channel
MPGFVEETVLVRYGMFEFDYQQYLPDIAAAVAILVLGLIASGIVARITRRVMTRAKVDPGLTGFLHSLTKTGLSILVVVVAISTAGVQMTSFVAILGAAGLAVGLAFQGSLSNFAGGVLILVTRPFGVGDFIETVGHMGTVREVQVLYTILDTPDNRRVVVPNGALANATIVNYSVNAERRVDLALGISYDADISHAIALVREVLSANPDVLSDPPVVVGVSGHGASSIDLLARFWTSKETFLSVQHDLYQSIKERFDAEGIGIPYPQRDVHLIRDVAPGADR